MSGDETLVVETEEVGTDLAVIDELEAEVLEPEVIDVEAVDAEPEPEPKPEAKPEPPKKTEDERRSEELAWLLEKIVKANEWRREAYREYEEAKSYAKEKKEIYEGAVQALNKYNDALAEIDSRPLLLKCDLDHAEPEPSPEAVAEEAAAEAEPAGENQPVGDWRSVTLTDVLGGGPVEAGSIGDVVSVAVDPNGVDPLTMDQVYVWADDGGRIVDLDLSDEDKVEFLDRLTAWASGYGWGADETYPDAFPLTYLTTKHHDLAKVRQRVNARRRKAAKAAS